MQQCRSPESCIYSVGVLGEGDRVHQHGSLEVTPSRLIYTPDNDQESYIWMLRHLILYSGEGDKFTVEVGAQCPIGPGLYTFSTEHAAEIHRIVARNTASLVTSPKHSATPTTDSQTTPHPPPTFPPPSPPLSSSPYPQRYNGSMSPNSHHPQRRRSGSSLSPSSSPTLSRSPSVRSLPENAFEVKNIGDDQSICQDGILEVTSQELIYTENSSQQRIVWPLMYLRRYGCSGNVFSIEAGRRCPGGAGFYAFSTPEIAELYELVQSYAKNLCSSQMSLCSMDYNPSPSSLNSTPSHNPQLSYSQSHVPSPGSSGRSESPVFQKSDSLIRRAFSALELRKNVFEVCNLGDNQQEVGKGILEVTSNDLIYIDSATGEKWRWPIKFLRRYGCNGIRTFSFEAGRRCPGGEGLYAFSTSRANEIHEAIIDSVNTNRGGQMKLKGNLSVSRLSLAEGAITGGSTRNGWSRKSSVPLVSTSTSSNHAHFLTPPPMRRPSHPTLDEVPSPSSLISHPPRTSTPTGQSLSSDETDTVVGSSSQSAGHDTFSSPQPDSLLEEKRSFSAKAPVQHAYDSPQEAKEEYLRQVESSAYGKLSKNADLTTSSPKKKKVKPKPPPRYKGNRSGELNKNQRLSTGSESSTHRHLNGYPDSQSSNSIPSSPSEKDGEGSFYRNIQIRPVPKSRSNGMTRSRFSNDFPDCGNTLSPSAVPQPSNASSADVSLYANLASYQRSGSDTPPSCGPQPDSQQQSLLYANLADFSAELENGRSHSTSSESRRSSSIPSSPSTLASSSYAEVEIVPPVSPDSTAWSSSGPSAARSRDSASIKSNICDSTSGGCVQNHVTPSSTSSAKDGEVIYNKLNFSLMDSLASLKRDNQTFADLLDRHTNPEKARDTSGSRKKK